MAINVANITAPAEISFAIPTSVENLLWKTASSENSMAELSISKPTTKPIAKKIIQIYIINKFFKTVIDILIYIVYKYN